MTLEKFYDGILEKAVNSPSYAANGWGSRRSAHRRYLMAITQLNVAKGHSLLDWGCGNGDLFWFLNDLGIDVHYLGVDIVPKMVELALANNVVAVKRDLLLDPPREAEFDHIICIGTVGAIEGTVKERWDVVEQMISVGMNGSLKGMALTFLTDRDGQHEDDGFHWFVPFAECLSTMSKLVANKYGLKVCADYHPHDVMFIITHDPY